MALLTRMARSAHMCKDGSTLLTRGAVLGTITQNKETTPLMALLSQMALLTQTSGTQVAHLTQEPTHATVMTQSKGIEPSASRQPGVPSQGKESNQ